MSVNLFCKYAHLDYIKNFTYKWYCVIFIFLWLTLLSLIVSRSTHVAENGIFFVVESYSIVYMYHIFFIHSSFDGHLGCFHVPVILNIAALSIGAHVSFQISVFSIYMPGGGIAGSYGSF